MDTHVDSVQTDETTKRVTLLIATVSSFLSPFMMSSINVALPTIGKEFQMDAILLSAVPMAYVLSGAIFLLPFGKIADIYGRKKVFAYGIALFTVSTVLVGVSISGKMLIFFRFLQGIGGAMTFGTGVALLMSVFPAEERGRVLGLTVAAVYVGLSVGPFVGGFLTEQFGWRSIFFLTTPLGAALVGSILWKLKITSLSRATRTLVPYALDNVTVVLRLHDSVKARSRARKTTEESTFIFPLSILITRRASIVSLFLSMPHGHRSSPMISLVRSASCASHGNVACNAFVVWRQITKASLHMGCQI